MERVVAQRVRAQRWYLRFPRGVPVAIFLLVSAITALSVFAIEQVETQRSDAQHRQTADNMVAGIERLANANAIYLRAGAGMMAIHEQVPQAAFREFARQLEHDDSLRSGGAMAYAPLVARSAVETFQAARRRQGDPAFTVHPQGSRSMVLPILYLEPDSPGVHGAVGFDLMSEPVRRAAISRAIRSGRPSATGAMGLVANLSSSNQTALAIVMPVFADGSPRAPLRGVIARTFIAREFLDAALSADALRDYGVALFDAEMSAPVLLCSRGPLGRPGRGEVREFDFADHRMRLEVFPTSRSTLSNLSLLTLVFGMMVAALLLVVARLVTRHASEDRDSLAWFEEQASIRNSLTRELNHRVKNTLANVLSIIALTRRRTNDIDAYIRGLTGRIRALSATHDLLTESDWGTTPVRAVIAVELAPYSQGSDAAVSMHGPHVELAPNDALSLGLAMHELATNASKYGALSAPGGEVAVSWAMMTAKLVRVVWTERGGPPVPTDRSRGFGTELIEKIVAHELRNPVDLQFGPDGVRCTLIVPVRAPSTFQMRAVPGRT